MLGIESKSCGVGVRVTVRLTVVLSSLLSRFGFVAVCLKALSW